MAFEDMIGVAVDHGGTTPPEEGARPSMDILSRGMFRDVVEQASHHALHRDMFASMVEDGVPPSLPDYVEPLETGQGPSDVASVENYLSAPTPSDTFAQLIGGEENPFLMQQDTGTANVEEMIRRLLQRL